MCVCVCVCVVVVVVVDVYYVNQYIFLNILLS